MATLPPSVELAYQQLVGALQAVGLEGVDPLKAPFAEMERGVARLLGGAFDPNRPEHQAVALGVAAIFGKRLAAEHGAFYAQNRESLDGFILGFPDALIMLNPFGAAMDALTRANLGRLDETAKEIRGAIARARLAPTAGAPMHLTAQDYERLFDPAFAQLVVLDSARLKDGLETPAGTVSRNLRESLERATGLPAEVRRALEQQLLGAFGALDPSKTLVDQSVQAGRLVELAAHLFATVEATAPAPEEFWGAVVFPLLFIGEPASFPPLDEDDKAAVREGMDPLFLYLDVVPYTFNAADDAVMGAFPADKVGVPHKAMEGFSTARLLTLDASSLAEPLAKFDVAKSRAAFERFLQHVRAEVGQDAQANAAGAAQVFDEAALLVRDIRRVFDARSKGAVAMRRITEAEAAGESALTLVRKAVQGPRIILG